MDPLDRPERALRNIVCNVFSYALFFFFNPSCKFLVKIWTTVRKMHVAGHLGWPKKFKKLHDFQNSHCRSFEEIETIISKIHVENPLGNL